MLMVTAIWIWSRPMAAIGRRQIMSISTRIIADFPVAERSVRMERTSYAVKLADMDGDGDLDIVQASDKLENQIYFNERRREVTRAIIKINLILKLV